jgi:SAM-dependent methyltransferase
MMSVLARVNYLLPPSRIKFLRPLPRNASILDVGCANHSPTILKHWLPECEYHAVDREFSHLDEADLRAIDQRWTIDLEVEDLGQLQRGRYDAVIFSHVIEHLGNGLEVLALLSSLLKPGGLIYIEAPSWRSIYFPPGEGTLNFYDDSSHVRLYPIWEIGAVCRAQGLTVRRCGRVFDPIKAILYLPFVVPMQLYSLARYGKWSAHGGAWNYLGFADYVLAERPAEPGSRSAGRR